MTEPHPQGVLEPGYRLLWYRIGRILGRGAFGTTYLAEDINLHRPVAIKEFFPSQYCSRQNNSTHVRPLSDASADDFKWAMERFLSEARTLAQFEHPNIIRVINVFEENGTAYMVMHYESGISLSALLKKRRTLNEQEVARITLPIMDGLEKVHASGFIHRDIKPSNIYIREGGSPVLLDFGSARQSMQEYTQTLTSLVSPGYAPIEQYTSKGDRQGPWTDIYGMGATLYRAVTGLVPPSAVDRSEALSEGKEDYMTRARELVRAPYSEDFLNAIDHALEFSVGQRPKSIAEWRTEFGFSLADIDTQPDYSTGNNSGGSELKPEQEPPPDNEVINVAGNDTKTAAMTAPTVQANAGNAGDAADHIADDSESPTERHPEVTASRPWNNRLIYTAAGIVGVLSIALIVFGPGDSTDPQIQAGPDSLTSSANTADSDTVNGSTAGDTEIAPAPNKQITALLDAARDDMNAMRLTTPADNNAHDKFRQVLNLEPDNTEARRGLEAIFNRYLGLAQQASQKNDFDRATAMLDRAETVKPKDPALMRARVKLEQRRTEIRMQALSDTMKQSESESSNTTASDDAGADSNNEAVRRLLGDSQ